MVCIGVAVYGASPGGILICLLFYSFYVQLPGLMIIELLRLDQWRISTHLMLGSFVGWMLGVFLVYLTQFIRTEILLLVAGPILSILYLIDLWRRKGDGRIRRISIDGIHVSFCIFFVLAMLLCLIGTQFFYLVPPKGDVAFINGDRAYHMGMANAISHSLPLESIWIKGVYVKYHIFTDILLSVPIRLFGVRTDCVGQMFAPLLTSYLVCTSMYAFFREMSAKPKRAGMYCLIFMLSSVYITRRWSSSLAFKFIFTNDNFAGFGLAGALIFIIVLRKWYDSCSRKDGKHRAYFLLCLLLIMLITGIKGPIAAVLVAGLWGTTILGIILRKMSLRAIPLILILTLGFTAIYISVLGAGGGINEAGGAVISFVKISDIAFWKAPLVDFMRSHGFPKAIRLAAVAAVFSAFFFTTFLLPFVAGYIRELFLVLSGKKEYDPVRVMVYAAAFAGFAALLVLNYTGHNQVYFGLVTIVLAPMISFWFIEDLEARWDISSASRLLLKVTIAVMLITLAFGSASLAGYYARRADEAAGYANQSIAISKYGSVSRGEYEAMIWIRENTGKDALMASDRYYSVPLDKYDPENRWQSSFFLYELYSSRFSYISGSAYDLDQQGSSLRKERIEKNRMLYDPDNPDRGRLARKLGIDYVIVSKRFSGELDLENEDYELCYTNNDIDIYRIK